MLFTFTLAITFRACASNSTHVREDSRTHTVWVVSKIAMSLTSGQLDVIPAHYHRLQSQFCKPPTTHPPCCFKLDQTATESIRVCTPAVQQTRRTVQLPALCLSIRPPAPAPKLVVGLLPLPRQVGSHNPGPNRKSSVFAHSPADNKTAPLTPEKCMSLTAKQYLSPMLSAAILYYFARASVSGHPLPHPSNCKPIISKRMGFRPAIHLFSHVAAGLPGHGPACMTGAAKSPGATSWTWDLVLVG